jgi:hypothetical protein
MKLKKKMLLFNTELALFNTFTQAEEAVKELQKAGFNMEQLSIFGRDYHTEKHVIGYYNAGDRIRCWGKLGALWGGVWGFFFGSASMLVSGMEPVLVAGFLMSAIVSGFKGAALIGGFNALVAWLYSIGIPKDNILAYERAICARRFALIANSSIDELVRARNILNMMKIKTINPHHKDEVDVDCYEEPVVATLEKVTLTGKEGSRIAGNF